MSSSTSRRHPVARKYTRRQYQSTVKPKVLKASQGVWKNILENNHSVHQIIENALLSFRLKKYNLSALESNKTITSRTVFVTTMANWAANAFWKVGDVTVGPRETWAVKEKDLIFFINNTLKLKKDGNTIKKLIQLSPDHKSQEFLIQLILGVIPSVARNKNYTGLKIVRFTIDPNQAIPHYKLKQFPQLINWQPKSTRLRKEKERQNQVSRFTPLRTSMKNKRQMKERKISIHSGWPFTGTGMTANMSGSSEYGLQEYVFGTGTIQTVKEILPVFVWLCKTNHCQTKPASAPSTLFKMKNKE